MSLEYQRCFALCDTILEATKKPFSRPIYYVFVNNGFNVSVNRVEQKSTRFDVLVTCSIAMIAMKRQTLEVLFCKYIDFVNRDSKYKAMVKYQLTIAVERSNSRPEVYIDNFLMCDKKLIWIPIEKKAVDLVASPDTFTNDDVIPIKYFAAYPMYML